MRGSNVWIRTEGGFWGALTGSQSSIAFNTRCPLPYTGHCKDPLSSTGRNSLLHSRRLVISDLWQSPFLSFQIPKDLKTKWLGGRAMKSYAPAVWNNLPDSIKNCVTFPTFRKKENMRTLFFSFFFSRLEALKEQLFRKWSVFLYLPRLSFCFTAWSAFHGCRVSNAVYGILFFFVHERLLRHWDVFLRVRKIFSWQRELLPLWRSRCAFFRSGMPVLMIEFVFFLWCCDRYTCLLV